MDDKYIIKRQVQGKDKKWTYHYLSFFAIDANCISSESILSNYDFWPHKVGAVVLPEAVAEWLCQLLEADGLHPEMRKI